ncbi:DALR anticodon-binding domain-containing protein [Streptomyces murinus]|uniref:ArgS-related anticodon-binding protein NrtL n=1 Tax=Streptomyces murinus TaxID=33900 RepID=UPI000A1FCE7A|nr:DALR anticodon-binding domain-containing protein [Streptomyces murinus]WDO06200.1 DALR anticodon-binding domain-containing protein [Streptomyces murinus]
MTPVELSRTVLHAVRCAVDEGQLSVAVPERVVVGEPGAGGCGEYATNVALQLARAAGKPPRAVAEILRPRLIAADGIEDVVVTGPGFLNFRLGREADPLQDLVREIRGQGRRYGHGDALAGQVLALRVPYEVRAEVVADAVVRIVASQGGRATVEHRGGRATVQHQDGRATVEHRGGRATARRHGGRAAVEHGELVDLRPVPAPEDPAPLGPDAARWALLHPAPHDRPRITADHLVQREGNPLFRVRYAHARVRSLGRGAARLGFAAEPGPLNTAEADTAVTPARRASALQAPALHTPLSDYPRILTAAATHRAPDRLARHLVTVADAVLPFLTCVLPIGEEKPSAAHRARLALAEAAGTVLAGGLSLLGIDAPEHL